LTTRHSLIRTNVSQRLQGDLRRLLYAESLSFGRTALVASLKCPSIFAGMCTCTFLFRPPNLLDRLIYTTQPLESLKQTLLLRIVADRVYDQSCMPAGAQQIPAAGRFSPLVPTLDGSDIYKFYCFRLFILLFGTLVCWIHLRVCLQSFWLWLLLA
jgi:uncharacterized membrane protein